LENRDQSLEVTNDGNQLAESVGNSGKTFSVLFDGFFVVSDEVSKSLDLSVEVINSGVVSDDISDSWLVSSSRSWLIRDTILESLPWSTSWLEAASSAKMVTTGVIRGEDLATRCFWRRATTFPNLALI